MEGFNRTIVELKLLMPQFLQGTLNRFNRTIVELKQAEFTDILYLRLI